MIRTLAVLFVAAAACSSGSKGQAGAVEAGGSPLMGTVTLIELSPGDIACYVTVRDEDGKSHTHPGAFEVCPGGPTDASPYLGFPVELTWETGSVTSADCGGSPDCANSDFAQIITSITPVK